jgi:FKBP-type peptidyl-prolyl cis-trans isomerase
MLFLIDSSQESFTTSPQPFMKKLETRMNRLFCGLMALTALTLPLIAQDGPEPLPEDVLQKVSYSMGMGIAQQIAQQQEDLNREILLKGFQDAMAQDVDRDSVTYAEGVGMASQMARRGLILEEVLAALQDQDAGNEPKYTEEELQAANEEARKFMQAQQQAAQQQQQQQQEAMMAAAEDNLKAGQEFLKENAGKEGVMTTLSGLQYRVIETGEGDKPAAEDVVKVHYTGKLLDGTTFDSSVDRGEPVEFPLNRVIPGWTEGLQLMSPGAKYEFWIPANLAYGPQGNQRIGPNQVLNFEVELLEVK